MPHQKPQVYAHTQYTHTQYTHTPTKKKKQPDNKNCQTRKNIYQTTARRASLTAHKPNQK